MIVWHLTELFGNLIPDSLVGSADKNDVGHIAGSILDKRSFCDFNYTMNSNSHSGLLNEVFIL